MNGNLKVEAETTEVFSCGSKYTILKHSLMTKDFSKKNPSISPIKKLFTIE